MKAAVHTSYGPGETEERPLTGIRVLDFTWVRAGPWATRWLALLGAEVLKVEWPDPRLGAFTGRLPLARTGTTPEGMTPGINSNGHFSDQNAHKLSITLNTRSEQLDQQDPLSHPARDFIEVSLQDPDFGAGRVVLVQLTDAIEELRARVVVEQHARQHLFPTSQPGQHLGVKINGCRVKIVEKNLSGHR